jgi:hypothetical protein
MSKATAAASDARRIDRIQPELLRLLAALPPSRQAEVLDFARFLHQRSAAPQSGREEPGSTADLHLAPASSLLDLTALVSLGGDAVADTEALYDDNGSGCD